MAGFSGHHSLLGQVVITYVAVCRPITTFLLIVNAFRHLHLQIIGLLVPLIYDKLKVTRTMPSPAAVRSEAHALLDC